MLSHTFQNFYGFFNFEDIYKEQVEKAKDGAKFVEIGSLFGRSVSYLGVEIKNSGKKISIDCIDYWDARGCPEINNLGDPCGYSTITHGPDIIFTKFKENMKLSQIDDIITMQRMSSLDASKLYEDNSLDFIFIDASHEYELTKNDINSWYPKLKNRKFIGGHDYDWPGVKQAVDEIFGIENIKLQGTSWLYFKDESKYSIIITYRNREEHLRTILPILQEKFKNKKYEIIISEQYDNEKFKMNCLYNVGVLNSTGDILIFHDVDYVPSENVNYWIDDLDTPTYPVRQVIFLDSDGNELDDSKIPAGYKHFKYDVKDHAGGVFILSKKIFNKIGGFNPCFCGWGCTDTDTRERVKEFGYTWKRNKNGLFFALYHPNSDPGINDPDEVNNRIEVYNRQNSLKKGVKDFTYSTSNFETDIPNLRWLKVSNIKY